MNIKGGILMGKYQVFFKKHLPVRSDLLKVILSQVLIARSMDIWYQQTLNNTIKLTFKTARTGEEQADCKHAAPSHIT